MKIVSQGHFAQRNLIFAGTGESYLIGRVHRSGNKSPKTSVTLGSNDVTHHETITTHAGFRFIVQCIFPSPTMICQVRRVYLDFLALAGAISWPLLRSTIHDDRRRYPQTTAADQRRAIAAMQVAERKARHGHFISSYTTRRRPNA